MALLFSIAKDSTPQKRLVSVNGEDYDAAELETAIRTVGGMLPTDNFSRTVAPFTPAAPASSVPENAAAGLRTPV